MGDRNIINQGFSMGDRNVINQGTVVVASEYG